MTTTVTASSIRKVRHSSGHLWVIVVTCPLCGSPHVHGGGTQEYPVLGPRTPHCRSPRDDIRYELQITGEEDAP